MSDATEVSRCIVCAAIKKGDLVIIGARHFDSIMRDTIKREGLDFKGWEQGFIDNKGVFIDRTEAWKIADAAGQIRRPTGFEHNFKPREANKGDDGYLFSENLY